MWQSVSLRAMCRRRRCSTLSGAVIDHSPRACSVLRLVFWVCSRVAMSASAACKKLYS